MAKQTKTDGNATQGSTKAKEAELTANAVSATLEAVKDARDNSMKCVEVSRSVLKLSTFGADVFVSEMGKRAAIALDEAVDHAEAALTAAKLAAATFAPLVK